MTNYNRINDIINSITKIHFVGIGGVSMSALAKYMLTLGKTVSGSDVSKTEVTEQLKKLGVKIYSNHNAKNVIGAEAVVYSSAVSLQNPELIYAQQNGILILKRAELLGCIMSRFEKKIAISGSHGKTTTTAMLSNVFSLAELNPTVFIGGEDKKLNNFSLGDGRYCIVEACEYKKNFLKLYPDIVAVMNIDNDHQDSFFGIDDTINAFEQFIDGKIALVNVDDEHSKKLMSHTAITFGVKNNASYMAKNLRQVGNKYSFTFYSYSVKRGRINLNVSGKHNVYNALVTCAISELCGIDFNTVKRALYMFDGVKRRGENIGEIYAMTVVADYAHHPKEILATLSAFDCYNDDTVVVFQPHTYSRTKFLFNDFLECLKNLNNVIIYRTYGARERYDSVGSAFNLYKNLKTQNKGVVEYANTPRGLLKELKKLSRKKGRVMVLGAGDIYDIVKGIIS